ncbi:MAG: hypothetical protein COA91_08330 [Robiginitomaculum sp.]|nr:MAG: hypothetical protein COA91_08330 [Robiginitomaculum sp.]
MDAVKLTQKLIQFDTVNPPGNERECGLFVADILAQAGFEIECQEFGDQHINVIAKLPGGSSGHSPKGDFDDAPLVLTGHLDTVPLGDAPWSVAPWSGDIRGGKLYGRGASDMKSGVAAMIVAGLAFAQTDKANRRRGLTLVFTSCEETGCQGALHLVQEGTIDLGEASAMIVGEPTENQFCTAHKGALFIRAHTQGVTAHSSMPDLGDNAIYKTAKAITKIENYGFNEAPHPFLGSPTINVGMVKGGLNVNSVPDSAEFTIDIRTNAAKPHSAFFDDLDGYLGDDIKLETFTDMPAISTDLDDPFTRIVAGACQVVLKDSYQDIPTGLPFFTDASALHPHYQCPTIILGPGELSTMHQTDEYCLVERIEQAVEIYGRVINNWCLHEV